MPAISDLKRNGGGRGGLRWIRLLAVVFVVLLADRGLLPHVLRAEGNPSGGGTNSVALAPKPGPMTAVGTNSAPNMDPEVYTIAPGDKLVYRVLEDRDDPRVLTVSPTGEIEVPYLGRILVEGDSLQKAAKKIKALLEKAMYYRASVKLSVEEIAPRLSPAASALPNSPKQIFVVGQVRAQGPQDIPPDKKIMLSLAIIKAGGFGSFADGKHVHIIRKKDDGKTERITVNVLEILKDGKVEKDVELMPDDMIIVPEKLFNL